MKSYKTKGVCATEILFDVKDNHIVDVQFVKGCQGNTLGLTHLLRGMEVNEAINKLKGIDCRGRGTSCPDQIALALEEHINSEKK
ncbi:MAG: TIGR03905 family protein [Epulopiscium sp. Nuni2H_MBin001]|nr:MAG: TIGR03905 family protein [Epulopiscium sp. Nuni2H_MBin001]